MMDREALIDQIDDLGSEIVRVNKENGWNVTTLGSWEEEYKIPAVLDLIHSEVSEALEAYRNRDREDFVEEMADTVICILGMTSGLGIPLGLAILRKLEINRERSHWHGGKK